MTEKNRIEKFLDNKNGELVKLMSGEAFSSESLAEIATKLEESLAPILDEIGSFFITDRGEATVSSPIQVEGNKEHLIIKIGREVKVKKV
ncbi:MAG: hypothetical protein AAFN77_19420 [Planctomycetota bacterium]